MNILGVGSMEFFLILVIAFVVAGPKRMLIWANIAGRYVGQARIIMGRMIDQAQKELDDSEVPFTIPRNLPSTPAELARMTNDMMRPLQNPVVWASKEAQKEARKIDAELKDALDGVLSDANVSRPTVPPPPPPKLPAREQNENKNPPDRAGDDFGSWSNAGSSEDQE